MRIFTLAIDEKNSINFTGDLTLQQAKQIIEAIVYQQAFEAGRKSKEEEQKNGKGKSSNKKSEEGSLPKGGKE